MPSRQNVTRRRQHSSESRMWWTWHPPTKHWQNMFNFIAVKSSPLHPLFCFPWVIYLIFSLSRALCSNIPDGEKTTTVWDEEKLFWWKREKVKSSIRKFFSSSIIQNDDGTDNLACAFFFFLGSENFFHSFSPDFLFLRLDKIEKKSQNDFCWHWEREEIFGFSLCLILSSSRNQRGAPMPTFELLSCLVCFRMEREKKASEESNENSHFGFC